MNVFLREQARQDLRDIESYLRPRSPQGFDSVMADIFSTLRMLDSQPRAGRSIGRGLWRTVSGRYGYTITYVIGAEDRIEVVDIYRYQNRT